MVSSLCSPAVAHLHGEVSLELLERHVAAREKSAVGHEFEDVGVGDVGDREAERQRVVERTDADPAVQERVRGLATEFGGNWLDFRRFEEHNAVDRERFPVFTNELRQAMFEEPVRFMLDVFGGDRSVLDFLYGSHTFVNPVLAKHYGVPGVYTFDFYDGWGVNYMMWVSNSRNSIGRFYETQGSRNASNYIATANVDRQWHRPSTPLREVVWSIRNNVNLQQSALLIAMHEVATSKEYYLKNFYLKSQRSVVHSPFKIAAIARLPPPPPSLAWASRGRQRRCWHTVAPALWPVAHAGGSGRPRAPQAAPAT